MPIKLYKFRKMLNNAAENKLSEKFILSTPLGIAPYNNMNWAVKSFGISASESWYGCPLFDVNV